MHQTGQRIKLKIDIDAPEITVPVSSQSEEVIVACLGHLELRNTFHLAESIGDPADKPPIYEEYRIELNDLKVYRWVCKHYS